MPSLSGRKTVASIGYPVALWDTPLLARRVHIQAMKSNTSDIYIGSSNVLAAAGSNSGLLLTPQQVYSEENVFLGDLYIDALVAGEGVTFLAFF